MKRGFTLIELLISVTILSLMMLFLYKSYASLNHSNSFYKEKEKAMQEEILLKKVIFLDFSLALAHSVTLVNQDIKEDAVFMQSTNSLHKRYNPYITYLVKNAKLYRLESLQPLVYPLARESEFSVEYIAEVESFRVYKSEQKDENRSSELYLVHVDFKAKEDILLKIKCLN